MTYPETELDLEAPETDAAEQAAEAVPGWFDDDRAGEEPEDDRVVALDDEYR